MTIFGNIFQNKSTSLTSYSKQRQGPEMAFVGAVEKMKPIGDAGIVWGDHHIVLLVVDKLMPRFHFIM